MSNQVDPILDDRPIDYLQDSAGNDSGESLLKTVWRHKLLVLLSVAIAAGVGYWHHRKKPTTFAAKTNLMIRSDNPLVLDVDTGSFVGGIPDIQVLTSLVKSDEIVQVAAVDSEMAAVSSESPASISSKLRGGLKFSAQKSSGRKSDRAIASLSFDGTDPDFCVAAVNSAARAIEAFFERERATSMNSFSSLISKAENKLLPELKDLESQYKEFRRTAPLDWSSGGEAVNPHRERLPILRAQLLELEGARRELKSDFDLLKNVWEKEQDLTLVTLLIKQMGGDSSAILERPLQQFEKEEAAVVEAATQQPEFDLRRVADVQVQDLELQYLQVEESLLALEVELESSVASLGGNHPSVRVLRQQVESTRKKSKLLAERRKTRMDELDAEYEAKRREWLMKQAEAIKNPTNDLQEMVAKQRAESQMRFISGYSNSIKQRIDLIDSQYMEIQDSISREKSRADALVQAETDDAMYRRQIDTVRGMLIQLEEQMAGLNISEVNNGVSVKPLQASVSPYVTGPNFSQDMLLSTLIGLGIGGLLSLMIESNARTFRNSEQISADLNVPVIAHIPLDDVAGSRRRTEATGELAKMHPNLSVVHRPECSASEAFRCARTNVLFDSNEKGHKVYQVTSPLPGDGKSTIAANIAATLAKSGKRTLLIDLDLRSPRLTARFELEGEQGVTNLLNGECDPKSAIKSSPIENLDVLPSGHIPSNPAEALLLPDMEDAFNWFRDQYDFVIVDTPPLLLVTDPAIITAYTDATILALRIVRKSKPNAKEAVSILRNTGTTIAGVVVNKIDEVNVGSYYQIGSDGSYRNVGYGYGKKYRNQRLKAGNESYEVRGRRAQMESSDSVSRESDLQVDQGAVALIDDVDLDDGTIENPS